MIHQFRAVRWLCVGWLAVCVLSIVRPAPAQEKGAAAATDEKALMQQVYGQARAAKSIDEFTAVVTACDELQAQDLSDQTEQYLKTLSAWILNKRGEAYAAEAVRVNQVETAAEMDAKALADFELSVELDATKWKPIHNRGVSLAASGRYEDALKDFDRVISLNRNYPNAWFNRGEARYALGQFQQAVDDYNRFLQFNSGDAQAYSSRGKAYFQLRRFREALSDFNIAVQLDYTNAEIAANRADTYQSLSMWQRAADEYRRAIALDDQLGRAYQSAGWLMATCPDARFRNPELGLQAAEKAIQLDGDSDYQYLDTLAAAQANASKYDEASASIVKAIDKAPKEEHARLVFRQNLYAEGQPYRQGMFRETTAAE